jgi:hypothetical protein
MPQVKLMKAFHDALGLREINQDLIDAVAQRIPIVVSKMDLSIYRRKPAQAAVEAKVCETIVYAFRDYNPKGAHKFQVTGTWPYAHCVLRGNRAWIEIDLGIDYSDPDEGLEVIEVQVNRTPKSIGIMEKIEDVLFNREPRKTDKAPPLELVQKAPPKRAETLPIGRPEPPKSSTKPAPTPLKANPKRPEPRKP